MSVLLFVWQQRCCGSRASPGSQSSDIFSATKSVCLQPGPKRGPDVQGRQSRCSKRHSLFVDAGPGVVRRAETAFQKEIKGLAVKNQTGVCITCIRTHQRVSRLVLTWVLEERSVEVPPPPPPPPGPKDQAMTGKY